ncbi:tigger transposable element-derived protein 4-like [Dermacentor silvarum]|uniref:tigger transposable element-derived protein 4-like n=1 Tax=Dermacentor silvarum TaxID=543639 RepID=UPI0021013740|nr:tigger transposable element-derived protein 4-like [Dermacentor silvarum]
MALSFKTISGESAAVNREVCTDWQQGRLQEILRNYEPRDVFNADEMGFFYKVLPSKTLAFKGEACTGVQCSKDRITVLVGANMAGDEKLKLLVVGKSKHPRCFKGVRDLPIMYHANGRAWMTMAIFENWLREEDARFSKQGRKVVFIADNCPAHGKVEGLKSITLEFLPANAVIQPMNQGVIQNIKVLYRRQLLHRMLLCTDNGKSYKTDLLSAIHILAHAWEQMQETTLQTCFHHAGFEAQEQILHEEEIPADADADAIFTQVVPSAPFMWQEYEAIDDNLSTCREESLEELIAEAQGEDQPSSSDECDDLIPSAVVPDSAAKGAVELLQCYFECEGCPEFLASLSSMGIYFSEKEAQACQAYHN